MLENSLLPPYTVGEARTTVIEVLVWVAVDPRTAGRGDTAQTVGAFARAVAGTHLGCVGIPLATGQHSAPPILHVWASWMHLRAEHMHSAGCWALGPGGQLKFATLAGRPTPAKLQVPSVLLTEAAGMTTGHVAQALEPGRLGPLRRCCHSSHSCDLW